VTASEIDDRILSPVKHAHGSGQVTVLLGAGASVTSGLPNWEEFATSLLLHSGAVSSRSLAEHLVSRQDPLLVAEAAKASSDDWPATLGSALYPSNVEAGYSPLHLAAANLRLTSSTGRIKLATLNFDVLLEDALTDNEPDRNVTSIFDSALSDPNELEVHHLHGLVLEDGCFDVVLTLTDYTGILETPATWQLDYLQHSVENGALVIAGTSYRDPDLRQWLHLALRSRSTSHPAVVLLAREAFDLDKASWSELRDALTRQWRSLGLVPVLLHDHVDAAQVIRELPYLERGSYVSPRDRAARLWTHHEESFSVRQVEDSRELAQDLQTVRSRLGVADANVTLWLADGHGQLVQYASHDRLFHDVSGLRRVPVGHDSTWIAAQALGREQPMADDLSGSEGATGRWRAVVAAPVTVTPDGMPYFASGALSIGLPGAIDEYDPAAWSQIIGELTEKWSAVLSTRFQAAATGMDPDCTEDYDRQPSRSEAS
jgi:hypothetical protein